MTPSETEYIEVSLRSGKKFIIDREAWIRVKDCAWTIEKDKDGRCYVICYVCEKMADGSKRKRRVRLSRFLMGLEPGDPRVVDHKDGNTLNNCSSNLRVCTVAENSRNQRMRRSNKIGFKGVSRRIRKDGSVRWAAYIMVNRKRHNLGSYSTPDEAHTAYCRAAEILHGEFANFGEACAGRGVDSNDRHSWEQYTLSLRLRTLERRLADLNKKRELAEGQINTIKEELASFPLNFSPSCLSPLTQPDPPA